MMCESKPVRNKRKPWTFFHIPNYFEIHYTKYGCIKDAQLSARPLSVRTTTAKQKIKQLTSRKSDLSYRQLSRHG